MDRRDLNSAIREGNIDQVKKLLEDGADPNKIDKYGQFPLQIAATTNQFKIVELLLAKPNIDVNQTNKYGDTALYWAAFYGYVDVVKLLLAQQNIDVNKANNNGDTALYWAAYHNHIEIVKLLFDEYIKRGIQLSPTEYGNKIIKELYGKRMSKNAAIAWLALGKKGIIPRGQLNRDMLQKIAKGIVESYANPEWMRINPSKRTKKDNSNSNNGGGKRKSHRTKKSRTSKKSHRMKKSNGVKKTSHTKNSKRKKPIRKNPIRKTPNPPLRRKVTPHLQHHI